MEFEEMAGAMLAGEKSGDFEKLASEMMKEPTSTITQEPIEGGELGMFEEAFRNIPSSALSVASDVASVFVHPVDSGKALYKIFKGAAQDVTGLGEDKEAQSTWDTVKESYKQRYGTAAGLEETFREDPVGLLADLSAVVSAGGGVVRGAGGLVKGAGGAITKAATKKGRLGTMRPKTTMHQRGIDAAKYLTDQAEKEGRLVDVAALGNTQRRLEIMSGQRRDPGLSFGTDTPPSVSRGARIGEGLEKIGGMMSKTGGMVTDIGLSAEPTTATMKGVGGAMRAAPVSGLSRSMYESAAKFRTTLRPKERERLIETALKYDIMPTYKGIDRLEENLTGIADQVTRAIDEAAVKGKPMPVDDLFKDFDQLRIQVLETSGTPGRGVNIIDGIEKQIREANERLGRGALSPVEAQRLKQGIYVEMKDAYQSLTQAPISKKAQMAVARAAKEYLEEVVPGIKRMNAEEGALIELREAIERSAARISNRDMIGIGVPIKSAAGGAAGGPGGATAGVVLGILDAPKVKAKLALLLNQMKTKGINPSATGAAFRLGLIESGRAINDVKSH